MGGSKTAISCYPSCKRIPRRWINASSAVSDSTLKRAFSCLYLRDGQLIAIDSINSPRDFMQSKSLIGNHAVISPDTLANVNLALKDMV